MSASAQRWEEIHRAILEILEKHGFECYPFKIGWYNEVVQKKFVFDYPYDTLAFIVISTPSMFDKAFKPFLRAKRTPFLRDPVDECMQHYFHLVKEALGEAGSDMVILHDYELHHSHRPKVLVQTAGHVAGAVRYYQRSDVLNDPWPQDRKIFPVAVHPKYGGWFALRGVFILPQISSASLPRRELAEFLSEEEKIEVLEHFNGDWRDARFRDVGKPVEKYSKEQLEYFNTPPAERNDIIDKIRLGVT